MSPSLVSLFESSLVLTPEDGRCWGRGGSSRLGRAASFRNLAATVSCTCTAAPPRGSRTQPHQGPPAMP
jgi:hypothetical protein